MSFVTWVHHQIVKSSRLEGEIEAAKKARAEKVQASKDLQICALEASNKQMENALNDKR